MHTSKIKSPAGILLFSSVIAAIGTHIYLLNEHLKAKYTTDPASSLCKISDYFNCGAAISSEYSEFLGTPLSVFAIFTQLVILFFALKALVLDRPQAQSSSSCTALTFTVFSAAVSVIMAIISVTMIDSLCPFCTLAYVLSLITLISGWLTLRGLLAPSPAFAIKQLISAALFIGALGFITGKMITNKFQGGDHDEMISLVVNDWKGQPVKDIQVVAPIKTGPDSAKMKIVEFADFLCSHCKVAFPRIQAFLRSNPNVQLQFHTFPLDGCREAGKVVGRQCQLGIAAYCANLQDKGEAGAEYLFNSQQVFAETKDVDKELELMATFIKVNKATFTACMKDPSSLEMVKKQIELGKQLDIQGTPTIYINNKLYHGAPDTKIMQEIFKAI